MSMPAGADAGRQPARRRRERHEPRLRRRPRRRALGRRAPDEATLQADAAAALGVVPGDTLSIQDTEVTVVGTWRVSDVEAPRWMADEQWTTGASGNTVGPLIIDRSVWSALDAEPWVHWAIIPDVEPTSGHRPGGDRRRVG